MKKKYIRPEAEAISIIGKEVILTGSNPENGFVDDSPGVGADDNPSPGFDRTFKSVWDD